MIYVTGDTHGSTDIHKLNSTSFPAGTLLGKKDYVIIAGDFGFIWTNPDKTEKYWLNWLREKPWTTLFIDGNHENFNRLNAFPEISKFDGRVGVINESVFHLKRGEVYKIDYKKIFVFGGAYSIDKQHRIKDVSWWPEELPNYSDYENGMKNLDSNNWEVDYVITHEGPAAIVRQHIPLVAKEPDYDLPKFFDQISQRLSFKHWYFGHYHIDKEINDKYTCLYQKVTRINNIRGHI